MKKIVLLFGIWICLNGLFASPVLSVIPEDHEVFVQSKCCVNQQGLDKEHFVMGSKNKPNQTEVSEEKKGLLELWQVTIHIIYMGVPPDSALVTLGDSSVWVYNNNAHFDVESGSYSVSVFAEGYYPFGGGEVIVNNANVVMNVTLYPVLYGVTLFVNCCGEPLEGIMLTIGTTTLITGANGLAIFNLAEGDYTVEINGYIFNFSVPESSYVDADICSEVTFHLTSQGNPVSGASVTVNNETIETNAYGEAIFCLQNGPYTYIITHPDYETLTGSFNVNGEPYTIEIWWPESFYLVIFNLSALPCNNSFDDLIIVINGDTISFGENVYLSNGNYSFSVYLVGCSLPIESGNIVVFSAPMTIELVLSELPQVTFHVTDQFYDDFHGAVVNVEDDFLITDTEGIATFCMTGGFHEYWVANPGYDTVPNNFVFPCQDTTIEVMLIVGSIGEGKLTLLDVYPNPSSGKFSIENINQTGEPIEIFVTDITGRVVYQTSSSNQDKTEIDLTGQPKGMYFIRVKAGEMAVNRKVVIQ